MTTSKEPLERDYTKQLVQLSRKKPKSLYILKND